MKKRSSIFRIISTLIIISLLITSIIPTVFAGSVKKHSENSINVSEGIFLAEIAPSPSKENGSFDGIFFDATPTDSTADLVKWRNIDGVYYLFVPSSADLNELQIFIDGTASVTIDGKSIENGSKTGLLSDLKEHTLSADGNNYKIKAMKSSNVGSIYITTESGNMDYINANKGNAEKGHALIVDADGSIVYNDALASIKGRGNSTWQCAKKPYNIKLDSKADLFGMGKSKKWCLLANHYDESLIRNSIMYDLADEVGILSEDNEFVDLYLNGIYNGSYLLTEKIEIEKPRVDIQNLADLNEEANPTIDVEECALAGDRSTNPGARKYVNIPNDPEDITGGFLLEFDFQDRYAAEVSGFVTSRGQCVVVKEPEFASKAEVDYIADYFQDFEDALYSSTGYNSKNKHYSEYCDIDSLARQYLIQELSLNIDAAVTSFYFYKDSDLSDDNLMYCDPTWDYDATIANFNDNRYGYDTTDPKVWYVRNSKIWQNQSLKSYLAQAYSKEDVYASIIKSWNADFLPALDILMNGDENSFGKNGKLTSITGYANEVYDSAKMNFTLWDILEDTSRGVDTGKTIEENIDYIRNFFNVRVPMMREEFKAPVTGIELEKSYAKLVVSDSIKIQPNILPYYASNKEVEYKSSNSSVAKVDASGNVTAVGKGSATITVKTKDGGFKAEFKVDVIPALTGISISAQKTIVNKGEKLALSVEAVPQDAELSDIKWSIDNDKIATIDENGILSAVSKGKVTVSAAIKDKPEINNSIEIEVIVKATSITISGPSEIALETSQKYQAIFNPQDATKEDILWSVTPITGDGTIDQNGTFTASKLGRVQLKAISAENEDLIGTLEVNVVEKIVSCEDLTINNINLNPSKGDNGKYEVTVTPQDCIQKVTFSSSNSDVFTVDSNGNWKAVSPGKARLTVTCAEISKTFDITVKDVDANKDNSNTDHPKTGDNNNMWIWIVLIVIAAVAVVAIFVIRKVKSKK